ncbi:hypothetical protein FACS189419_06690 [Planctomycetales bacterium]|nr:hypothetical protein FACS189419_06690 [Planctomycetales bacterium]
MLYRLFFVSCFVLVSLFLLENSQRNLWGATPEPVVDDTTAWFDAAQMPLYGKGWTDTNTPFTRIPQRAQKSIPASVWSLSQHSAGVSVRFKTDSPTILAKHELNNPQSMSHMTIAGSSGLDLYGKDDNDVWRWAGSGRSNDAAYTSTLLSNAPAKWREYIIYLPLYNSTKSLSIGIPKQYKLEAVELPKEKPVFYYGTSIAHGCSASRPGYTVPAILERRLSVPVINFGFSGSGKMEPEMEKLIEEVDASVFVLDCLPNMSPQQVEERTEPFIRALRSKYPNTPIIMIEGPKYCYAWIQPEWTKKWEEQNKHYRAAFEKLTKEEVKNLYYIEGEKLYGEDGDGAVDGVHPSDLGMFRNAEVLFPVFKKILGK